MGRSLYADLNRRGRQRGRTKKNAVEIKKLLGFALGCIRLSFDDFCRLTPEEFSCVADAYREHREADLRDSWERMRLHASIAIQPHVKGRMTPAKLVPLPWDTKKSPRGSTGKQLTKEETKKRFEKLIKRLED